MFAGFKNFDVKALDFLPKEQTILVYCSVGWRSARIGEPLMESGFEKIYNLYGGIFEWVARGNKIYASDGTETESFTSIQKHGELGQKIAKRFFRQKNK